MEDEKSIDWFTKKINNFKSFLDKELPKDSKIKIAFGVIWINLFPN